MDYINQLKKEKLKKENKDHIDLLSDAYANDLKGKKFNIPLIFINKEEDKVKQEQKKLKQENIQTSNTELDINTNDNYKKLWNLYNEAKQLEPKIKEITDKIDINKKGIARDGAKLTNLLKYLPIADKTIKKTQTNPNLISNSNITTKLNKLQEYYDKAIMGLQNEKIIEGLIFSIPALPRGNSFIKLDNNSFSFKLKEETFEDNKKRNKNIWKRICRK